MVDEMNAWSVFLNTGSVADYIRYATIRNSAKQFDPGENYDEDQDGRAYTEGTEYRGAR